MRLPHDFGVKNLRFGFGISTRAVSEIFNAWIDHMYLLLGIIPIWPHQGVINERTCNSDTRHPGRIQNMAFIPFLKPKTNWEKCFRWVKRGRPHSQQNPANIDRHKFVCTKYYCSLKYKTYVKLLQFLSSETVTKIQIKRKDISMDIKNMKNLGFGFGISTRAVSKIFNAWIDHMYLLLGIIPIWPHQGVINENKGFTISEELQKLGLHLNTPWCQLSQADVHLTQKIAQHCIHVERAIKKIQSYKIISNCFATKMFTCQRIRLFCIQCAEDLYISFSLLAQKCTLQRHTELCHQCSMLILFYLSTMFYFFIVELSLLYIHLFFLFLFYLVHLVQSILQHDIFFFHNLCEGMFIILMSASNSILPESLLKNDTGTSSQCLHQTTHLMSFSWKRCIVSNVVLYKTVRRIKLTQINCLTNLLCNKQSKVHALKRNMSNNEAIYTLLYTSNMHCRYGACFSK
ncbi:hypothetical protein KUTeg_009274 [Tegillarca granosa]|uniref:DDE Tnp4 domain-containing protein n=1 Tax=Tegillarca granosa TaxID=220873 RepID=A0ABQ9F721_TEGGR|nr:hypothetical protein KUTeg_009274 [Tegillarca granosa]